MGERVYHGIPASPGVCQGKVMIIAQTPAVVRRYDLVESQIPQEIERLERAMLETRKQIIEVQHQVSRAMGAEEANIFEAHLMILEDPFLLEEVGRYVQQEKANVEFAFHAVTEKYLATLSAVEDEYLRERTKDIQDVSRRVLNNLSGRTADHAVPKMTEPCVVISEDLAPSLTAQLDRKMALGFATDIGSKTSHTAILARSLRIPAVVGLKDLSQQLSNGQHVLLDGFNGLLFLNPTDQTLFEYGQLVRRQLDIQVTLQEVKDLPPITLDGHQITLSANVEQAADTEAVQAHGAEGVGLFRTEYLFLNQDKLPSEDEQYLVYHQVATTLNPQPVVIRTLDIGGDKFISHLHMPAEINPFLGWRAIRFCLEEKAIFRNQLRAILRASAVGNVKMMFPMISALEELEQALALVDECKNQLTAQGQPFNPHLEIGVMIEVPSAVMIADSLAKRVSFFSLGTNDLIQYATAVDRLNEKIAHLYQPTHPAIVRLIKMTIDAAHRHQIWTGICGETAGDLSLVPLLLGLGVDELSVAAPLVPQIKYLIRHLKMTEAKEVAEFALQCEVADQILERSRNVAPPTAPALLQDVS
jgi:phosphoenolpyruvate-protein phosphotransferase (PTS system enzyme I)